MDLFPDLRAQRTSMKLRSVRQDEEQVRLFADQAFTYLKNNTVGLTKYLTTYRKYADLLNGKAEVEVDGFLQAGHTILSFKKKIDAYHDLKQEVQLLRITAPLSMFLVDCNLLNENLAERAQKLRETLVQYEVDENRELNRA